MKVMEISKFRSFVLRITGSLLALWLSACGVSTSETAPGDTITLLNEFMLEGNVPANGSIERIAVPMQNNDNASALFHMSWDATSSDPYQVIAHLSDDASFVLDISDQVFLDIQCGTDGALYNCDSLGDLQCSFRYAPDYKYLVDQFGEYVLDEDGNRIRDTLNDGSYWVLAHHYYIGCGNGPGTIRQAEITDRVLASGFPTSNITNPYVQYVVFTVCNDVGESCSAALVQLEIYDSIP